MTRKDKFYTKEDLTIALGKLSKLGITLNQLKEAVRLQNEKGGKNQFKVPPYLHFNDQQLSTFPNQLTLSTLLYVNEVNFLGLYRIDQIGNTEEGEKPLLLCVLYTMKDDEEMHLHIATNDSKSIYLWNEFVKISDDPSIPVIVLDKDEETK